MGSTTHSIVTGHKRRAAKPVFLPTGHRQDYLSTDTNSQQQETGIVTSIAASRLGLPALE